MNNKELVVEFRNVTKSYGSNTLFDNFNMTVTSGEMICIAGGSGSGKSTILNLIGMFDKPDRGEIYLFGKKIPKINSKEGREVLRTKLLYIFQNFALLGDKTIDYNLDIPLLNSKLSSKDKAKMKQDAIKKVGLEKSLKTKVYQLSGGEQQRIALARGYLKDFDLILADEPTGSLDATNRDLVISMLRNFNKNGKTVIIVSHDPIVMRACDRVITLDNNSSNA
ncbi:ABC transporter ATP-binding protein [Butyrivibrio sp. NC3005]|uniref:ABC transporter ATP-binding protein n=1 Tax=Butyrivibrio sp. NC3005 TaxID=1280685 RepID=UPI0004114A64|nr:ABC transporter ATP-binding protein [Butyrivibrio sp. NC3005]